MLRGDPHATEPEASVGGGLSVMGVDGAINVWYSLWFMLKVTPVSHPWTFLRMGEPKRVIGAMEADRLSNMDGSRFVPKKRIPVETSDLSWHILEDALRWGAQLQRMRDARGTIETVSRTLGEVSSCTQRDAVPIRKVVVLRSFGKIKAPGSGADVCANSGLFARESHHGRGSGLWCGRLCQFRSVSPEKESRSGTMEHVSVPFRHASGGAAYSPMGVGVRSILHIARERDLF